VLTITVPGKEFYDEEKNKFFTVDDAVLELEHSLASLSKWESIHQKPFLGDDARTAEEVFSYIECMLLSPEIPPGVLSNLTQQNFDDINAYVQSMQTATTFGKTPKATGPGETITSELIYYWMVAFKIPWEAQYWHLNRLFALIRVCNIKNQPPKKMSRQEQARQYRELNEKRRAQLGTRG